MLKDLLQTFVFEWKDTILASFGGASVGNPLVKFFEREASESDGVIARGSVAKKVNMEKWTLCLKFKIVCFNEN